MALIADLIYLIAIVAVSPVALYKMIRHRRYLKGWGNRFGDIKRNSPQKKCIWIHAVSVGEVNATKTIVKQLKHRFKEYEIVISVTTDTGFERAGNLYGKELAVFYFPWDFSFIIKRAFKKINPSLCMFMELEIWPNFVKAAKLADIPVVIVNGRISENSFRKYKLIRPIAKSIFSKIDLIGAQTDQYAKRFINLGAKEKNVFVTSSLKYDTAQMVDRVEGADELGRQLGIYNQTCLVAGGTGDNEEKIIIKTFKKLKKQDRFKNLLLAIIPRKPERFDEIAELIKQKGFDIIRYSKIKGTDKTVSPCENTIILGDTMGDLRKFYSLATIIFVGRSLVPMGGSDMLEAAALGKCTIFGPYAFNFKQTVEALSADNGAILVNDEDQLCEKIEKCLSEPEFAKTIAKAGREVIRKNQGATVKTIEYIANLLDRRI